MKVLFVLSFIPNPRMNKRIRLLCDKYEIGVVYWNRENDKKWVCQYENVKQYNVKIKANHGSPLKRIVPTIRFSWQAMKILCEEKPDCIYVQNVDMLFIACKYQKRHKCKIIYEIADIHALVLQPMRSPLKKMIQHILQRKEEKYCKNIDLLIVTSERFYTSYYAKFIPENKYFFMPNAPEKGVFEKYEKQGHDEFTVGFVGGFRFEKQLELLIEACKDSTVKLFIAGYGSKRIEELCKKNGVDFFGRFDYARDIVLLYQSIDCVFSVYPEEDIGVQLALPNKLYEAIVCELPIIASNRTYLGEIVKEQGIGITVDCNDVESYKRGIEQLKDERVYTNILNCCKKQKELYYVEEHNKMLLQKIRGILGE